LKAINRTNANREVGIRNRYAQLYFLLNFIHLSIIWRYDSYTNFLPCPKKFCNKKRVRYQEEEEAFFVRTKCSTKFTNSYTLALDKEKETLAFFKAFDDRGDNSSLNYIL
jgi:hypothetical protein